MNVGIADFKFRADFFVGDLCFGDGSGEVGGDGAEEEAGCFFFLVDEVAAGSFFDSSLGTVFDDLASVEAFCFVFSEAFFSFICLGATGDGFFSLPISWFFEREEDESVLMFFFVEKLDCCWLDTTETASKRFFP